MEMKNFTGGENLQTAVEFFCSAEFTGEVHGELIFLSVVNTCLSITAFLGNALILVALHKTHQFIRHPNACIVTLR